MEAMMTRSANTSQGLASEAARVLSDPNASATEKSLAGSALAQAQSGVTSAAVASAAGRVLQDEASSDRKKSLAASALAQRQ
jgi:anti-sigma factor ChrR (cupin superfamily)